VTLQTDTNRIFGLDLMRALAIIFVLKVHGAFLLYNTPIEGFPFFNFIDGVEIFFVLSGFLIGKIILKELVKSNGLSLSYLLTFWKRRWFRTLPAYYLILLANYFVVKYGIINEDIQHFDWRFLVFMQNFNWPFTNFFWESWSLSVEEWFYLLTPILIWLFSKFTNGKNTFLIATLLIILLPLWYRYNQFNPNLEYFDWDNSVKKIVLGRLDSIGYGLLAAWTFTYYNIFWQKLRWVFFILGAIILILILNHTFDSRQFFEQVFYLSCLPLAVLLTLPLFNSYKKAKGWLAISIQHISKISYSMYLINLALVAEVIAKNWPPQGGLDGMIKYGLFWFIVIAASTLLYYFFEKPVMNLRDRKFF